MVFYISVFSWQICLAHRSCMGYTLDVNWLRKCGHWDDNDTYSFEEFCCILAEYHSQKKSVWKRLLDIARNVLPSGKDPGPSLLKICRYSLIGVIDWDREAICLCWNSLAVLGVSHNSMFDCNKEYDSTFDIYLGGSCGDSEWRDNIAIPMIR